MYKKYYIDWEHGGKLEDISINQTDVKSVLATIERYSHLRKEEETDTVESCIANRLRAVETHYYGYNFDGKGVKLKSRIQFLAYQYAYHYCMIDELTKQTFGKSDSTSTISFETKIQNLELFWNGRKDESSSIMERAKSLKDYFETNAEFDSHFAGS